MYNIVCTNHAPTLPFVCVGGTWPRLQVAHERPHWIGIDFEHWEYQPESDDEESGTEGTSAKMVRGGCGWS